MAAASRAAAKSTVPKPLNDLVVRRHVGMHHAAGRAEVVLEALPRELEGRLPTSWRRSPRWSTPLPPPPPLPPSRPRHPGFAVLADEDGARVEHRVVELLDRPRGVPRSQTPPGRTPLAAVGALHHVRVQHLAELMEVVLEVLPARLRRLPTPVPPPVAAPLVAAPPLGGSRRPLGLRRRRQPPPRRG